MKLGIMQPYFMPYIGYWQLLNMVDIFVVYDNIEYTKKSWVNKNNILINQQKKLFTIPLKKDSDYLNIIDRKLSDSSNKDILKILRQIKQSYIRSPYFKDVFPLLEKIFLYESSNLFEYIFNSIIEVCQYCEISSDIVVSSSLDINHDLKGKEKVIAINKKLGANEYINSIGGIDLYSFSEFNNSDLSLFFLKSNVKFYEQNIGLFEPNLSIIDIMMFNSKNEIKKMLNSYHLIGENVE